MIQTLLQTQIQNSNSSNNVNFLLDPQVNTPPEFTFSGEYLFIANCLLLLSFLQRNQLMFRLVIISATLFFLMSVFVGDVLFVDTLLLHTSFILINSYTAYKLFFKIIPPEIDKENNYVYNTTFSKFLTKAQYYKLNEIAKRRVYRVNSSISLTGNGFVSIFLIICVPEEAEIKLRLNELFIANLEEQS